MTESFIQYTYYCKSYFIQKLHLSSRYLIIALVFLQLLVTGCTINQSINNSVDWVDHNISNYKINGYRLKGSFTVEIRNRPTMSSFELSNHNNSTVFVVRNFIGQRILTENSGSVISILDKLDIDFSKKEYEILNSYKIDLHSILLADISKLGNYSFAVDKDGVPKSIITPELNIFFDSFQSINNIIIPRKIRITSERFKLTIVNSTFDNIEISS